MIRASRIGENKALEKGEGTLKSTFQELELFYDQWPIYKELLEEGLNVHVYGRPDNLGIKNNPDEDRVKHKKEIIDSVETNEYNNLTIHASTHPELTKTWVVSYDGAGEEEDMWTLLSEETMPGSGEYQGVITTDEEVARDKQELLDQYAT